MAVPAHSSGRPPPFHFSQSQYSAQESNGMATVTIEQSEGDHYWAVSYGTKDGTAQSGLDYQPSSGTIQWRENQSRQDINIPLTNDVAPENPETFSVRIGIGAMSAGDLWDQATVTVYDDDAVPTLVSAPPSSSPSPAAQPSTDPPATDPARIPVPLDPGAQNSSAAPPPAGPENRVKTAPSSGKPADPGLSSPSPPAESGLQPPPSPPAFDVPAIALASSTTSQSLDLQKKPEKEVSEAASPEPKNSRPIAWAAGSLLVANLGGGAWHFRRKRPLLLPSA